MEQKWLKADQRCLKLISQKVNSFLEQAITMAIVKVSNEDFWFENRSKVM